MESLYLASPYSHPDADVRARRYLDACRASAWMFNRGIAVHSSIAMWHPIAIEHSLPTEFSDWQDYNFSIIDATKRFAVLLIPGWKESVGVTGEIARAKQAGRRIEYALFSEDRDGGDHVPRVLISHLIP